MNNSESLMRRRLRAAQPLNDDVVNALSSTGALADSLADLCDRTTSVPRSANPRQRRRIHLSGLRFAVALTLAACMAIAIVGVSALREEDSTGSAWAAADIALAKRTPQLLLTAPGWRITTVDQNGQGKNTGEINYKLAHSQNGAGIFWVPRASHAGYVRDRAYGASEIRGVTVRGIPARVFYTNAKSVGGPNVTAYSALWLEGNNSLRFESGIYGASTKRQRAKFLSLLADVTPVQTDVWLSAMPKSVLLPTQIPVAAEEILARVPQPAGFSIEPTLKDLVISDRYQLRFHVLAAVECVWIKDWLTARHKGDKAQMREIAHQASRYKHWPINEYVQSLSHGGALDIGLGDGTTRDVVHDYKSGLGCGVTT